MTEEDESLLDMFWPSDLVKRGPITQGRWTPERGWEIRHIPPPEDES